MKEFLCRLAVVTALLTAILLFACSEKRSTDLDLTDLSQITSYINNDVTGVSAYPLVWIDTVSRADRYSKPMAAVAISPLDFWVELLHSGRSIEIADSCARDEFNEGADSCDLIQLDSGARARTRIARILDSLVCRYHIVDRSDSSVTTKDVKYKEIQYALMAKLDNNQAAYRGWRMYAVGRHRHGLGYTANTFPVVDSVVLESRARAEQRVVSYPTQRIRYVSLVNIPTFYPGEPLRLTAFTRARFGNPPIQDAYAHINVNGTILHDWMGPDVSTDEGKQIFEFDFDESSGLAPGLYAQVTVELFQEQTLREEAPNAFANMIWGITYRVEQ